MDVYKVQKSCFYCTELNRIELSSRQVCFCFSLPLGVTRKEDRIKDDELQLIVFPTVPCNCRDEAISVTAGTFLSNETFLFDSK